MSGVVSIDRVHVRVPGADVEHGRRLGNLVAQRLAPALRPRAAAVDRLRVELTARPGESVEALAGRIAAELALALAREVGR